MISVRQMLLCITQACVMSGSLCYSSQNSNNKTQQFKLMALTFIYNLRSEIDWKDEWSITTVTVLLQSKVELDLVCLTDAELVNTVINVSRTSHSWWIVHLQNHSQCYNNIMGHIFIFMRASDFVVYGSSRVRPRLITVLTSEESAWRNKSNSTSCSTSNLLVLSFPIQSFPQTAKEIKVSFEDMFDQSLAD